MLNRDFSNSTLNIIRSTRPNIEAPAQQDYIGMIQQAGKNFNEGMLTKQMIDEHPEDKARIRQMGGSAYADMLKEDELRAEKRQQELDDIAAQRDFQREMMDAQLKNSFALENMRHNNAMGLAQFKAGLAAQNGGVTASPEQIEAQSREQAQSAINQLGEVAERNKIGVFTNWRREHGLTGKETEQEYGRISSAVAGLAPRAISKLKAAGVSGINSLPEFMTYIGLPQNPTSEQIRGALPMMAQIAGVDNPLVNEKQRANPIPQQQPSLANFSLAPQSNVKEGAVIEDANGNRMVLRGGQWQKM